MFTGIIRHVGKVISVRPSGAGKRLAIDLGPLAAGLELGQSVAIGGACLSAVAISGGKVEFDAIGETLSRTTLGDLRAGDRVNLERSLQVGQGLDGHLVQGHVDGLATLRRSSASGKAPVAGISECVLEFDAPVDVLDLMVPKGSVAIDGVSLTLVDATAGGFSVALIPTTLRETTLGDLKPGDKVNIETDVIGKYVRKYLQDLAPSRGGITLEKLRERGFA